MAINQPDLTGDLTGGTRSGVPGGVNTPATPTVPAILQPGPGSLPIPPAIALQTRWRPQPFTDFHLQMKTNPVGASAAMDFAIRQAYQNTTVLETMIASRQSGAATITGSKVGIPTGLTTVRQVQGSIDNGSTAHNFYCSVVLSKLPGCIDIYVWQPTAVNNVTPIACTSAVVVRWVADGSI